MIYSVPGDCKLVEYSQTETMKLKVHLIVFELYCLETIVLIASTSRVTIPRDYFVFVPLRSCHRCAVSHCNALHNVE